MAQTVQERFETKFTKGEGCWEWTASKFRAGYGRFLLAGRMQLAHRVAHQTYIGEIPDSLCVCHRCDNPGCVNPDHLFLGTRTDNMRDCANKGRLKSNWPDQSGEKHWKSKLTEENVGTIRTMLAVGVLQRVIARQFGVTREAISKIACGRNWTGI